MSINTSPLPELSLDVPASVGPELPAPDTCTWCVHVNVQWFDCPMCSCKWTVSPMADVCMKVCTEPFVWLSAHLHAHVRHTRHCTFTCNWCVHVNVQLFDCLMCSIIGQWAQWPMCAWKWATGPAPEGPASAGPSGAFPFPFLLAAAHSLKVGIPFSISSSASFKASFSMAGRVPPLATSPSVAIVLNEGCDNWAYTKKMRWVCSCLGLSRVNRMPQGCAGIFKDPPCACPLLPPELRMTGHAFPSLPSGLCFINLVQLPLNPIVGCDPTNPTYPLIFLLTLVCTREEMWKELTFVWSTLLCLYCWSFAI